MCYVRAWQNQIGVLCVITKTNKKQYNEYFFAHSTQLHHKMRYNEK